MVSNLTKKKMARFLLSAQDNYFDVAKYRTECLLETEPKITTKLVRQLNSNDIYYKLKITSLGKSTILCT